MHRITNLNIANSSEGEADHRVTISIEAIAFGSATKIESLPEPTAIADDSSLLAVLSKGDIFRRQLPVQTYVQPTPAVAESLPEPEVQAELPPQADPQKSVRFVASVWNGGEREAWLVDGRSSEEISVVAASELKLPDISGRIISIDDDVLHLELHGKLCSVGLGKTLSKSTVYIRRGQQREIALVSFSFNSGTRSLTRRNFLVPLVHSVSCVYNRDPAFRPSMLVICQVLN